MIRIALISDIHFGKYSRTDEFSVPGEEIQDENKGAKSLKESLISILKKKKVQYIFAAGDLTSVGSPQEFHYCERELLDIAQCAGIPKENIILGLGNHDIDWRITQICDDYTKSCDKACLFELVKSKYQLIGANAPVYSMSEIHQPLKKGPAPFSGIVENNNFIVFILNSGWCCTHDQTISHGKLSDEQLGWFKENAEGYKSDSRWKIVLMHHHPFNYSYHIPVFDVSMIEEGSDFLDIAGQNGINLVLHGHRHHPRAETCLKSGWVSPITFVCAGSLTVNSAHRSYGAIPNTFHIIELFPEPSTLKLHNFQYSPYAGWIPIKDNCQETPLDSEMMLGKLYSSSVINQSILALATKQAVRLEDLDDCLRFITVGDLNQKVQTLLSDTHKMIGQFPNEVILIKKEG